MALIPDIFRPSRHFSTQSTYDTSFMTLKTKHLQTELLISHGDAEMVMPVEKEGKKLHKINLDLEKKALT